MSRLICDFGEFESKRNNIVSLIESYKILLSSVTSLSSDSSLFWNSDSEKMFHSKFMERQSELLKLSESLDEIESFLTEVISTYQNIEGKYS